jgi:hypothetical protein
LAAFVVLLAANPCGAQGVPATPLPPDPSASRLFLAPTGRTLAPATGYGGLFGAFVPFGQVGLSDRVSLGVGMPAIIPGLQAVWVTPKVQVVRTQHVQAAGGLVHVLALSDQDPFGIGYGVATFGTDRAAVTAGVGRLYARGVPARDATLFMVGAERRVDRTVKLIVESYVSDRPVLIAGVRLIRKRAATDLALMTVPGPVPNMFPFISVVWSLGRR